MPDEITLTGEKVCTNCGEAKPLDAFWLDKNGAQGRQSQCAECLREKQKRHYRKNGPVAREMNRRNADRDRERRRAQHRKSHHKHRAARNAYSKARRDTPKGRARRAVRDAVRRGHLIKPASCERCGQATERRLLHGHHHDYDKPLEVEWLCSICHGKEHRIDSAN